MTGTTDPPSRTPSIRGEYVEHGVRDYYAQHGDAYRNPHEPIIRELLAMAVGRWQLDLLHVLDLACGSGEVTLALRDLAGEGVGQINGIDPYTAAAYQARVGNAAETFSFEQIAGGALDGRSYSVIVCSFALHLVAESWLPALCYQLGQICHALIVLTPHKRPELRPAWGWLLTEEVLHKRVRMRRYAFNAAGDALRG
jgi:SAM-dependent methyltransferase